MTNVVGLWVLYVLLFLLLACTVVSGILLWILRRMRAGDGTMDRWSLRIVIAASIGGIGLAVVSWLFALVLITPAGIVERLGRGNPVLVAVLLGYTAPAILGGYVLRRLDLRR